MEKFGKQHMHRPHVVDSFSLNSKIANTETDGLSDANFAILAREEEVIFHRKKEHLPTDSIFGLGVSNAEGETHWEHAEKIKPVAGSVELLTSKEPSTTMQ